MLSDLNICIQRRFLQTYLYVSSHVVERVENKQHCLPTLFHSGMWSIVSSQPFVWLKRKIENWKDPLSGNEKLKVSRMEVMSSGIWREEHRDLARGAAGFGEMRHQNVFLLSLKSSICPWLCELGALSHGKDCSGFKYPRACDQRSRVFNRLLASFVLSTHLQEPSAFYAFHGE